MFTTSTPMYSTIQQQPLTSQQQQMPYQQTTTQIPNQQISSVPYQQKTQSPIQQTFQIPYQQQQGSYVPYQQNMYVPYQQGMQQQQQRTIFDQQCPSDEDFEREIENDPQLKEIIENIVSRIPYESCGVHPPRHRREERIINSNCPPRTANIRRRLQSPEPDIIERRTIIRSPQDTINIVIEKPSMPPPCVYEKTDHEPVSPPRIQHQVVCVPSSGNCPPDSQPDNDDNLLQQQQQPGQQVWGTQSYAQNWRNTSQSQYVPMQQQSRYQLTNWFTPQQMYQQQLPQQKSSQTMNVSPVFYPKHQLQQQPSYILQGQQYLSNKLHQQQQRQQQIKSPFSPQLTTQDQNIQQQSYYWPQTQPQSV